ncbi:MAG: hypothetical protein ACLRTA_01855 [Clostridia bacterium]
MNDLDVHEAWANQICRKTEEMPVIDWTKKQLQQDEPEEPESVRYRLHRFPHEEL